MTVQLALVLATATLAAAYLVRSLLRASCASGCGSCGSRECPARKLQRIADKR
ncbi:hypothetical protein [Mesoterricola sediminis]|uniref:FeoB-associated Cys-rich membrane protein n=1 Tax=Mesoterricola sediminis TaxID=2927980 RepID=A0AA48KCB3_9BACT|nr:hypothetical protein [Mesoterricola sediminis]BDU75890.1 hypothetical protein METESE_08480 [Mesoterricola sediminis]